MKAVILAAGRSERAYPLTCDMPKPLLPAANRPLIEWNLIQLRGVADHAVVITEKGNDQIEDFFGSSYRGMKLSYEYQKKQEGTGRAVLEAEAAVKGRFVLLMGDDLYDRRDIRKCLSKKHCILYRESEHAGNFGVVESERGVLKKVREKPARNAGAKVNTGMYALDHTIFDFCRNLKKSPRGEYEFTDALNAFSKKNRVAAEPAGFWAPVNYPWDLLEANSAALGRVRRKVGSNPEKFAIIKGKVEVGRGTVIRSGSYVEGPAVIGSGCDIGPNCYIRPGTSIGDRCRIGASVEVKNSVIMENSSVGHLSYVGDSVIGKNSNIGAGFIAANLRHDGKEVKSVVKGVLVGTDRRKQGAVIGSGVKTGIGTLVYPGRKIWPGKTTLPGEIVKKDVE